MLSIKQETPWCYTYDDVDTFTKIATCKSCNVKVIIDSNDPRLEELPVNHVKWSNYYPGMIEVNEYLSSHLSNIVVLIGPDSGEVLLGENARYSNEPSWRNCVFHPIKTNCYISARNDKSRLADPMPVNGYKIEQIDLIYTDIYGDKTINLTTDLPME